MKLSKGELNSRRRARSAHTRRSTRLPVNLLVHARSAAILCHRHADVDAYASAYATAYMVRNLGRRTNVEIGAPGGFSTLTKRTQEKFPALVSETPNIDGADVIIIVDTGHVLLLGEWKEAVENAQGRKVFIDHHLPNESIPMLADTLIMDETASSASEIVYGLIKNSGVKLTKKVAQVLLTGILFDSQHLKLASPKTLKVVVDLCQKGASLDEAKSLLTMPRDRAESIARLKATRRLRMFRLGDFLLAWSKVGSFQASVARALLDVGADVAFAVGERDGLIRASMRSTRVFQEKTSLHLGRLVSGVSSRFPEGFGGGHPTAASLTCKGKEDDVVQALLKAIENTLTVSIREFN